MIQIRNVPDAVHREAKARAAEAGISLSEFALQALEARLGAPTLDELTARIRELPPVTLKRPAAEVVREARDRE